MKTQLMLSRAFLIFSSLGRAIITVFDEEIAPKSRKGNRGSAVASGENELAIEGTIHCEFGRPGHATAASSKPADSVATVTSVIDD